MKDLLIRVKDTTVDRRLELKGTENLTVNAAAYKEHESTCLNCDVPGGCDPLHYLCELRIKYRLNADGTSMRRLADTPIERERVRKNAAYRKKAKGVNQE